MKPRLSVVTLAVDDLNRALAFYRDGLGLPTDGIVGTQYPIGACVFFEMEGGVKLALWPRASLRADTGLDPGDGGASSVMLAHNVGSPAAVREVMMRAVAAGAREVKSPQTTFWGGYGGCFRDPDGHLWEVVHNPKWPVVD